MKKERLDLIFKIRGWRKALQGAGHHYGGLVFVAGQRVDKPGTPVDPNAEIEVRGKLCPM